MFMGLTVAHRRGRRSQRHAHTGRRLATVTFTAVAKDFAGANENYDGGMSMARPPTAWTWVPTRACLRPRAWGLSDPQRQSIHGGRCRHDRAVAAPVPRRGRRGGGRRLRRRCGGRRASTGAGRFPVRLLAPTMRASTASASSRSTVSTRRASPPDQERSRRSSLSISCAGVGPGAPRRLDAAAHRRCGAAHAGRRRARGRRARTRGNACGAHGDRRLRSRVRRPSAAAPSPTGWRPCPRSASTSSSDEWSGGDLLLIVASDEPGTVAHALRMLAQGLKGLRDAAVAPRRIPQGVRIRSARHDDAEPLRPGGRHRKPSAGDGRLRRGGVGEARCPHVAAGRHVVRVASHRHGPRQVGRRRSASAVRTPSGVASRDGSPLTGTHEHDALDLEAVDANGLPVISSVAHAQARARDGPRQAHRPAGLQLRGAGGAGVRTPSARRDCSLGRCRPT